MSHPEYDLCLVELTCSEVAAARAIRQIHELGLTRASEALRLVRSRRPVHLKAELTRPRLDEVVEYLRKAGVIVVPI